MIRHAITQYETRIGHQTLSQLTPDMVEQIDLLLATAELTQTEESPPTEKLKTSDLAFLKTDPGTVGLGTFLTEIEKLKRIHAVGLPPNLFAGVSPNGEVCHR